MSDPLAELSALVDRLGREPVDGEPGRPAAAGTTARPRPIDPPPRLKSVAAFERTLTRMRTERVLRQAQTQVPQRAGPLNASNVTNRLLQALHESSPAYLEAFMAQVDTLLWLEQASGAAMLPAPRKRRTGA